MRDLLIFALVFGLIPFILKRPAIGIFAYSWISLMNPHRLAYGAAYDFPFAALIVAVTFAGIVFSKEPKRLPVVPVTVVLLLFICWTTFTALFALEPERAWIEWNRVMKTFLMTLVAMYVIQSEKDIKAFAWVLGLSLGFYGLKGGVFTILSGGVNRVYGPLESYIADNNHLALALLISLPLLWFLVLQVQKKWQRYTLLGIAGLTLLSVVGTYSRGAFLGGIAMLAILWLKSRHKLGTGLAVLIAVPIALSLMPPEWFERMYTIKDYAEDDSALGRINAWLYAMNLASHHFLGGGFDVFTPRLFLVYAPEPLRFHAAHSIYFQVLGEHGYVGLSLYILLMICAWRSCSRVIKASKKSVDLKWAGDLAAMSQVSLVGYIVGGAFLSLAYFDYYYYILAMIVLLEKFVAAKGSHVLASSREGVLSEPSKLQQS